MLVIDELGGERSRHGEVMGELVHARRARERRLTLITTGLMMQQLGER